MTEVPDDRRTTDDKRADRSFFGRFTDPIGERVKREVSNLEDRLHAFVQSQTDKVKESVKEKVAEYAPSVGAFGVAAVLAWLGVLTLVATAVLGLATVLAPWLAALLVAVALFLIAGGLAAYGRAHLPKTEASPKEATATTKPEVETVDHLWVD